MLQCKTCGSLLAGTDRHDKCVVHRLCSRSIPCPLDSGLDSAYWDEVEAIRAAAMGVRQVDGRKKKPDKPKVTVTKKGKKGSKGSLPRGVDPPVSTSQLVVQDDSELSCSIASCGSEVSAAVCNTSTIVGNFTGIDGSRGEHVLPRSVNNFPVGFSHGEHVLPNYPTASINSLQPNPNLINNVVQIDQANMGSQQGPIDHANSVTQNVNTSYANEIQISSGSGLISKPTQSTRDVIQTSDIDRASMSPQVSLFTDYSGR